MVQHVRASTIEAVKNYAAGPKLAKEIITQATSSARFLGNVS